MTTPTEALPQAFRLLRVAWRHHDHLTCPGARQPLDEKAGEAAGADEAEAGHGSSSSASPMALAVNAMSSSVWTIEDSECSVADGDM